MTQITANLEKPDMIKMCPGQFEESCSKGNGKHQNMKTSNSINLWNTFFWNILSGILYRWYEIKIQFFNQSVSTQNLKFSHFPTTECESYFLFCLEKLKRINTWIYFIGLWHLNFFQRKTKLLSSALSTW